MAKKIYMVVDADSCGGEEKQFVEWMWKNHPEVDVDYQPNVSGSGCTVDEDGNHIDCDFWDRYCSK